MEFNFSPFRLLLLAVLVAIFWLLGGFSVPQLHEDDFRSSAQVAKAWRYCVIMFIAGAVSASIIDHYAGNIDRTNLRLLYVLLGLILMIGSYVWLKGMKSPTSETANNAHKNTVLAAAYFSSLPHHNCSTVI